MTEVMDNFNKWYEYQFHAQIVEACVFAWMWATIVFA